VFLHRFIHSLSCVSRGLMIACGLGFSAYLSVPAAIAETTAIHNTSPSSASASSSSSAPNDAGPQGQNLEAQLKAAVIDAQSKLGKLESWQTALFTDEVIPQFQRFIKDYRASTSGLVVDLDYESLKHFLAYHETKTQPVRSLPTANSLPANETPHKLLVYLKSDSSCPKCRASLGNIQTMVRQRLERRGLSPIWLNSDDFSPQLTQISQNPQSGGGYANNKLFFEQMRSSAKSKNAEGALLISWALAPQDDTDSAHADEKRYLIESSMQIHSLEALTRQKELLDNDSFEIAETRLLTELFTDLGSKFASEQSISEASVTGGTAGGTKEEILVQISGVKDFNQYSRIKTLLQSQLKDINSLEDREFSKNQVVFAVTTKQTVDALKKQIGQLSLDPGNDQLLTVVVQ